MSEASASIRLQRLGKPIGITFVAISIIVLLVGFHRYFESQRWIIRGKFPAGRMSIFIVALIAAGMIVGSLVILLIAAPDVVKGQGMFLQRPVGSYRG